MFQSFKQIDQAYRLFRNFCLVIVCGSFLFCGLVFYQSHNVIRRSEEKIYVIAGGKIWSATESSRGENISAEARDHIRSFHEAFFTLDPDEQVIQKNITRALYLADVSAKRVYDNLREQGYYRNLISGNISQTIAVDSIVVDAGEEPYYWRCYATEQIVRATSVVTRELTSEGYLRSVTRSDHNPHGFLVEKWRILTNRDIRTEPR